MSHAGHLFKHLVFAFKKHELEMSYQRRLQIHTLKEKLGFLEKKLEGLKHAGVDQFRVEMLRQRIDEIRHLFP